VSVPQWFETEKPALIDNLDNYAEETEEVQLPRCGINGSENFQTDMEYLASAQYAVITLMCVLRCIPTNQRYRTIVLSCFFIVK
jgi:hypothetical protein